jgi:DNA-binding SARP family transcriptional activator
VNPAGAHRLRVLSAPPRLERPLGESPERVELPPGKPLALLAYLHLRGGPVEREALCALLWPESSREKARGSLRHALWTLRTRVGEGLFATEDPVTLAPGWVESDLGALKGALVQGGAEGARTALALWEFGVLRGFSLGDAPEWDRWAESLALELERRTSALLAEAAREALSQGQGERALELLRGRLRVEPDALKVRTALIQAQLDLRAFRDADLELQEARERFEDAESQRELGVLDDRLRLLEEGGAQLTTPDTPTLAFVGRGEPFSRLLNRWREARSGSPGIGVIVGDPGIGKTRLAEELRHVAESEGGRTLQVKAEDSESPIEWGLLSEVLQRLLRLSGAAGISPASDGILRSFLPGLALPEPGAEEGGGRGMALSVPRANPSAALSDALIDLVTAVSEDAPLFLLVDDLHWADSESRTVLARVATRLTRASALLVFTCRTEAEDARVRKTLALLAESPLATTVELEPWSFEVLAQALKGSFLFSGTGDAEGILRRIHQTTRGNPLFVLELLKVFLEKGILEVDRAGGWIFHPERLPPDLPLPQSVRALVDRQLDQLSSEATLLAAQLARVGHGASPRLLALQTGLGTSAVTNGIGELLARRMVRWEGSDALVFVHDELRAAVSRRYQLRVGLTAGGGTQWSLFRSVVFLSLAILLLGAAVYAFTSPDSLVARPWGGGRIAIEDAEGQLRTLRLSGSTRPVLRAVRDPLAPADPGVGLLASLRPQALSPDFRYRVRVEEGEAAPHLLLLEGAAPEPLGRWDSEEILDLSWCGPDRILLLARAQGRVTLHSWSLSALETPPTPIPLPALTPGGSLACSPDGRYVLLLGARSGERGLFLHDLITGATLRVDGGIPEGARRLRWVSDRPALAPDSLALRIREGENGPLGVGGQRALEGVLVLPQGLRRREPLFWASDHPEVATISADGRLTALAPGSVTLRARWGATLEGTLTLEVRPEPEVLPLLELALDGGDLHSPLETVFQPGSDAFTVEIPLGSPPALIALVDPSGGFDAQLFLEVDWGAARFTLTAGSGFPGVRGRLNPEDRLLLTVDSEGWATLHGGDGSGVQAPLRLPRSESSSDWSIQWVPEAAGSGGLGPWVLRIWPGLRGAPGGGGEESGARPSDS